MSDQGNHSNLDALLGELMADRDRHRALSEHRSKLLNEAHRLRDNARYEADANRLFTKNEALAWLADGSLPANFTERVDYYVERYECGNCDGQVSGTDHNGEWSCPECAPEQVEHSGRTGRT